MSANAIVTATIGAIVIATRRWTVLVDLLLMAFTPVKRGDDARTREQGPGEHVVANVRYSRFIIASASISRSTNCSPEMSTTASLMEPPLKV